MRRFSFLLISLLATYSVKAQDQFVPEANDTVKKLAPVIIIPKQQSPERMPETKDNVLFSGKKK